MFSKEYGFTLENSLFSEAFLIVYLSDLMYSTMLLSRFMSSPSDIHLGITKRVPRYLKRTTSLRIWYKKT